MTSSKQRIAILGGGVGALACAFELTGRPGWSRDYELTVYQMGWRLGGKGASGRNRDLHQRIEEHGLHMFLGFYDNAFGLMQRCYAELGRHPDAPLARWDQAFRPHDYFVLEETVGARKVPWEFRFPPNDDVPGRGGDLPSVWAYVQMALGWLHEGLRSHEVPATRLDDDGLHHVLGEAHARVEAAPRASVEPRGWLGWVRDALMGSVSSLARHTLLEAAVEQCRRLPGPPARGAREHAVLTWLLEEFLDWLREHVDPEDTAARRRMILVDLTVAAILGLIGDDLLDGDRWFEIDDLSLEEWLQRWGAEPESVVSPPMQLLRQLVFADDVGVGAGTALHYTLRLLFDYKGAFGWKMQAGMGDVVFAPLYTVLRRRGVKFRFFHRVDALELSADRTAIERVRMGVQARVRGEEYDPLVEVEGLPCWPSAPVFERLVDGEALRASGADLEDWWTAWRDTGGAVCLERGRDFDAVVLGIAMGGLGEICKELVDDPGNPRFGQMVQHVRTTQTQALQLWFTPDLHGLGWTGPSPILGTNWQPFDTWADMSHLIPRESWPARTVGNIAYMCSALDDDEPVPPRTDHEYPARQAARVVANARTWLERIGDIWPAATRTDAPGALNYWLLVDDADRPGPERLAAQYWRAPLSPSERYVLSVPGSVHHRLRSDESGYDNLILAGDWTLTSLSAGCVEAAVMSGMHAARALCGAPERIVGDWLGERDRRCGRTLPPVLPPSVEPRPTLQSPSEPPRYLVRDGNDVPEPPYTARAVEMYSFLLECDYDALAAVCDRYLNLGPVEYRPLAPVVAFVAASMQEMSPREPGAWLAEKDFGFWMPVVGGHRIGETFVADRLAMYLPYLWVDGYLPTIAGREVFGYPKGSATLRGPEAPGGPGRFAIDALVVPRYGQVGDPQARWQTRRLLEARRRDGGAIDRLETTWHGAAALAEGMVALLEQTIRGHRMPLPSLDLVASLYDDVRGMTVPMVFLKQFRDVEDPRAACYQAIVEAPNVVVGGDVRGGWLGGDWEVAIEQYASCRILQHLGIVNDSGVARSVAQFWTRLAFEARPGRVVWRAV